MIKQRQEPFAFASSTNFWALHAAHISIWGPQCTKFGHLWSMPWLIEDKSSLKQVSFRTKPGQIINNYISASVHVN